MGQVNAGGIARRGVVVEAESLANGKRFLAIGEAADAQFGALQVGENPDRTPDLGLDSPDAADQRAHKLVIGMAHIDAEDIRTRFEKFLQGRLLGRSRTDCCEYLDLAATSH